MVPTNNLSIQFQSEWALLRGYLKPHPNIIRILNVFTAKPTDNIRHFLHPSILDLSYNSAKFIVMEYHPHSLATYLTDKIPFQERLRLCQDLATGLLFLFDNMVIHGDIKLDNLLVSNSGRLVITDFGTARRVDKNFIAPRVIDGNLAHLAPEILNTPVGQNISFLLQPSFELGIACYEITHHKETSSSSHPFSNYPFQFAKSTPVSLKSLDLTFKNENVSQSFVEIVKKLLQEHDKRISLQEAITAICACC